MKSVVIVKNEKSARIEFYIIYFLSCTQNIDKRFSPNGFSSHSASAYCRRFFILSILHSEYSVILYSMLDHQNVPQIFRGNITPNPSSGSSPRLNRRGFRPQLLYFLPSPHPPTAQDTKLIVGFLSRSG